MNTDKIKFVPAFTPEQEKQAMTACTAGWDVSARLVIVVMTRTQADLAQAASVEPEAFAELVETILEYSNHCQYMKELADAAFSRLMLTGAEALGIELGDGQEVQE